MAAETEAPNATANGSDGEAETAAAATQAAAAKNKTRQYGVFTELVLDLTQSDGNVVQQIKDAAGVDQEGKPLPAVTILLRYGRGIAKGPREALEEVGKVRDLAGDYNVIADSSRTVFKDVSSKIERVIKIG